MSGYEISTWKCATCGANVTQGALHLHGEVYEPAYVQQLRAERDRYKAALEKILEARPSGCSTGEAMSKAECWAREALHQSTEGRHGD